MPLIGAFALRKLSCGTCLGADANGQFQKGVYDILLKYRSISVNTYRKQPTVISKFLNELLEVCYAEQAQSLIDGWLMMVAEFRHHDMLMGPIKHIHLETLIFLIERINVSEYLYTYKFSLFGTRISLWSIISCAWHIGCALKFVRMDKNILIVNVLSQFLCQIYQS